MKKNAKYILSVLLLFAITLGFASQNNLGLNFANWGVEDEKKIEAKAVVETIQTNIIEPIRKAIQTRDPHMFMTKCYTDLVYDMNGYVEQETPQGIIESGRTYYSTELVQGTVRLINCGETDPICRYRLHLEDNTVEVKESYLSEWKPLNDLLKKIETTEN